jgi:hypothetical protein
MGHLEFPHMTIRTLALALALGAPALAADVWVDPVNGSNAHGGTSPQDAWRTVTHALATLAPGEADVIHLAAGVYDASTGEVFPLRLRDGVRLHGEAGAEFVRFEAGAETAVLVDDASGPTSPRVVLHSLKLVTTGTGVAITAGAHPAGLTLTYVKVQSCTTGVQVTGSPAGARLVTDHVALEDCTVAIDVDAGAGVATYDGSATRFFTSPLSAVRLRQTTGVASVLLSRCDLSVGEDGVLQEVGSAGLSVLEIQDSLLRGWSGSAVRVELPTAAAAATTSISRCTVTGNGAGYRVLASPGTPYAGSLRASILHGNGDDYDCPLDGVTVTSCDIGDGDFAGRDGNFSLPPRFRAPGVHDYTLRRDSPCLDVLPSGGGLDLYGRPRGADGDLDVERGTDLGAFELLPLLVLGTPELGGTLSLWLTGAAGDVAVVLVHRGPQTASPIVEVFGQRWLPVGDVERIGAVLTQGDTASVLEVTLPNDGVLAGQELSFQALVRTDEAPAGAAWSNAVSLTVTD